MHEKELETLKEAINLRDEEIKSLKRTLDEVRTDLREAQSSQGELKKLRRSLADALGLTAALTGAAAADDSSMRADDDSIELDAAADSALEDSQRQPPDPPPLPKRTELRILFSGANQVALCIGDQRMPLHAALENVPSGLFKRGKTETFEKNPFKFEVTSTVSNPMAPQSASETKCSAPFSNTSATFALTLPGAHPIHRMTWPAAA